jgi:type IV pilus assembly protein PilY1
MVYAAANDGMLHGFVGSSGVEQFAYIPSALFQGPTGTPQVNGLVALGNPNFAHHDYVDATPAAFDIDLNRTGGNTTGSPNWHTLLIGGLGKGGTSYYAIDVTNPASMTSESAVAGNVLWEFTDSTMGYSFGTPVVVKTAQYGWVVVLTSGYDNSDGYGYLYLLNPANGALLQKIKTPNPSSGLAQASAYVQNYTDYTADSVYVGDLNGQLWRFDLTAATGTYPAPTQIASLTDGSGNPHPSALRDGGHRPAALQRGHRLYAGTNLLRHHRWNRRRIQRRVHADHARQPNAGNEHHVRGHHPGRVQGVVLRSTGELSSVVHAGYLQWHRGFLGLGAYDRSL